MLSCSASHVWLGHPCYRVHLWNKGFLRQFLSITASYRTFGFKIPPSPSLLLGTRPPLPTHGPWRLPVRQRVPPVSLIHHARQAHQAHTERVPPWSLDTPDGSLSRCRVFWLSVRRIEKLWQGCFWVKSDFCLRLVRPRSHIILSLSFRSITSPSIRHPSSMP
jgi:hypothetical protein